MPEAMRRPLSLLKTLTVLPAVFCIVALVGMQAKVSTPSLGSVRNFVSPKTVGHRFHVPATYQGIRSPRAWIGQARLEDGRIEFTDAQLARFLQARKDVKSGSGDAYWQEIADIVGDGITPSECKALANNQLFKKAAGTAKNFFKSYVDVKGEYIDSGYVDASAADPMTQMGNFFGGLFGQKKEIEYSEDGFYVGQSVQYKSATFNKWMDAKVERLNKDGTIDLNCRDKANPKLIRAL
mmetsp:Transcript_10780/g.16053  ORF Transcript_10780/g.16053 Transcript_10780/m.16053 type:complete len:238 (-) Transcript_10780:72-785(-)